MSAGMNAADRPILLATGGTGGHVFPAQALAGALIDAGHRIALITDRRATAMDGPLQHADAYRVNAAGISGRNILRKIAAVARLGIGYFQARDIIRRIDPKVVVGFGSYASVPAMAAAIRLHHATVIHEQNAILGRANRFLASRVTRIATAFKTVGNMQDENRDKVVWTGNPVRPDIVSIASKPYPAIEEGGEVRLLVFGGSLGATVFSEVVPKSLAALPETLRNRIRVVQQCRKADLDEAQALYRQCGIEAEIAPFFDDLPDRLATAHLVICRSGASTIAELTAAGRPAILVPYPHATDDHQTRNAEGLCDAGGGWLIPQQAFNVESLGTRLTTLLADTRALRTAAMCAGRIGVRDATAKLAHVVTGLLSPNESTGAAREVGQ